MQLRQQEHHLNTVKLLGVFLSLYVAQGLPVGFMTQALPTLLRHYGISLTQIGFSGLLMAPWALKFLWAPYIDQYRHAKWGHYRPWILATQMIAVVVLMGLAYIPIAQLHDFSNLWGFFLLLLLLNFICASQDIATDALAVRVLKAGQIYWGNTIQVMGSRLGFILGGGAVLYAIDFLSWKSTFLLLALAVFLNSFPILFYQEHDSYQKESNKKPRYSLVMIKNQYGFLWRTPELRVWLMVLLSYKIADGLSGAMMKPMMIDMGLSLAQIGIYVTTIGASCAFFGAFFASVLIKKFRLQRMLICFAMLQALGWAYYGYLAYSFQSNHQIAFWQIYLANAFEEMCSAMNLVVMLSLMMHYARTQYAGTDFSLQVALMSIVSGGLYIVSGGLADVLGYTMTFILVLFCSFLCFIPKLRWLKIETIDKCD